MADRILIVEDEADLAEVMAWNLRQAGFETLLAGDGATGLRLAHDAKPALVLLDLMLPDLNGVEICKRLRGAPETARLPIVMLTARAEEPERVGGFEAGADDYITKPFSVREVVLRIKAVLRRAAGAQPKTSQARPLEFGALVVDRDAHRVFVKDKEVELTATEFRLLLDLIDAAGRVRPRDVLLDRVWGYVPEVVSRTVDTHIRRLREKLGAEGDRVETVRGFGYRFRIEET